ncbi:MAG: universal stress protein [Bacteroidales bacterium]|nr:universal stress protein [Bacteroidales bacterium]
MKSIIVGTDFSKGSYVALEIAVDIANQLHTGIRLLWVKKEKKLLSGEQMEMTAHLAEEKLDALCQQHQPNLRHGTITSAILSGKVATCIAEEAVREEAPMIVIGTNGASGFEKYWMGSTAVRIVQEAPCPTLTIREGYNFHKKLENIVVPIRINANSRQKVAPAAQMARIFGSHVYILGLLETAEDALILRTYLKQVEDYFNKEGIPNSCCGRRYENYSKTVLDYAASVNADLVVINTEQDRLLARLFLGTNAQQIVHHSQIPVLCIHPEDIGDIAR